MTLRILSAGAAQGVVTALAAREGIEIDARFGAVGAIEEAFEAGTPCDLLVLTRRQIDAVAQRGRTARAANLGRVRTGIAVRAGDPWPQVSDATLLRRALRAAEEIHHPDAVKSTAGIHFARVLAELGIAQELWPRLRPQPNGATAMRALAASNAARAIGCTQITEIRNTPGVALVAALPKAFELATTYSAALCSADAVAGRLYDLLTGEASARLRTEAGFEP